MVKDREKQAQKAKEQFLADASYILFFLTSRMLDVSGTVAGLGRRSQSCTTKKLQPLAAISLHTHTPQYIHKLAGQCLPTKFILKQLLLAKGISTRSKDATSPHY